MSITRDELIDLIGKGWVPPPDQLVIFLEPDPEAWRPALHAHYLVTGAKITPSDPLDSIDLRRAAELAYAFRFAPPVEPGSRSA